MGHLRLTIGYLRPLYVFILFILGHLRVIIGHFRVILYLILLKKYLRNIKIFSANLVHQCT